MCSLLLEGSRGELLFRDVVIIVSGTSDEYISLQWTHYRVSRDTIIIPMTKIYEQPIPR